MAINLNEHKFFDYESKLEVVPLSVAIKAVEEAIEESQLKQLDKAIETLSVELTSLKPDLSQLKD
tara:strand:- start:677 stop:871 length:195 start_codon:yes stop_codon:yes gene_type:complete